MTARQVEITVRDRAANKTGVFRCDADLLRQNMRYFDASIKQQETELALAAAASPSSSPTTSATSVMTLKATCELPIFEWLMQWIHHHDEVRRKGPAVIGTPGSVEPPVMTIHNAVSLLLSSTFLQIPELPDEALSFVRGHLASIVDSHVNLDCLRGDMLDRLSAVVRPADVARALLKLQQQEHRDHPNRTFLAVLLRRLAELSLSNTSRHTDHDDAQPQRLSSSRSTSSSPRSPPQRNPALAQPIGAETQPSWCRLCHNLFDATSADRAREKTGAAVRRPLCPGLVTAHTTPKRGEKAHGTTFQASQLLFGPRGELYETHVASDSVLPACEVHTRQSDVSAETALSVELWSWRVLGITGVVQCRHCDHLVALIEAPSHQIFCPSRQADTAPYAMRDFIILADKQQPENRASDGVQPASMTRDTDNSAVSSSSLAAGVLWGGEECRAVLNYFFYATEHDVYQSAKPLGLSSTVSVAVAMSKDDGSPTTTTAGVDQTGKGVVPLVTSTSGVSGGEGSGSWFGGSASASAPPLSPLVCRDSDALAAMRSECICLVAVPVPTATTTTTNVALGASAKDRACHASNVGAGSRSSATQGQLAPQQTRLSSAAAVPSSAVRHQEEAQLSRALSAQELSSTRARIAERLDSRYGITSPLLLTWRQLPQTVVQEVITPERGVDSDVQTYVERQMLWDMDAWVQRVSVRRVPKMRLSLSTALPSTRYGPISGSPSAGSPMVASLEISPRPQERSKSSTVAAASTVSKRRTLPTSTQSPLSSLPPQRPANRADRRAAPAQTSGATEAAGERPAARPKLATRVSNPYATSKPAAAAASRRRTS